jgi:hypothetical protein
MPLAVLLALVAPVTSAEIPRIAVLLPEAAVASLEVGLREGYREGSQIAETGLRDGPRELGYIEGKYVAIDWRRVSNPTDDKLRSIVTEWARSHADVIVAFGTPEPVPHFRRQQSPSCSWHVLGRTPICWLS